MDNGLMALIRAVVRPLVTISGWGAVLGMVLTQTPIPEWFQVSVIGLTTWWFATRKSGDSP